VLMIPLRKRRGSGSRLLDQRPVDHPAAPVSGGRPWPSSSRCPVVGGFADRQPRRL